jgi:hypothetical protein
MFDVISADGISTSPADPGKYHQIRDRDNTNEVQNENHSKRYLWVGYLSYNHVITFSNVTKSMQAGQ